MITWITTQQWDECTQPDCPPVHPGVCWRLAVSKKHLWNRPGICAGFILVKISQSPKMSKYLKGFPSSQWKRGNTSVLYTVCLYRGNVISKLCEFVGSHTFLCVFHIDMNGGEAFCVLPFPFWWHAERNHHGSFVCSHEKHVEAPDAVRCLSGSP